MLPNLSDQELEKWQGIYTQALKDISMEKGKREAYAEYHSLQKKLQEIYSINSTLQDRIKHVEEHEFSHLLVTNNSKEIGNLDKKENYKESF